MEGCEKQAQGTHNGMCKRHWRAVHFPDQVAAKNDAARKKEMEEQPPPPHGESVYDNVLPASIAYRPSSISSSHQQQQSSSSSAAAASHQSTQTEKNFHSNGFSAIATPMRVDIKNTSGENGEGLSGPFSSSSAKKPQPSNNNNNNINNNSSSSNPSASIVSAMPLVNFLRDGALHNDVGWHRQAERRARGIFPCSSLSIQLEPWEKQLALVEILLLSGGTPHANFRDLAHAWGRERGFHQVLASSVCTRRGEVERKRRSDAGKRSAAARGGDVPGMGDNNDNNSNSLSRKRPKQIHSTDKPPAVQPVVAQQQEERVLEHSMAAFYQHHEQQQQQQQLQHHPQQQQQAPNNNIETMLVSNGTATDGIIATNAMTNDNAMGGNIIGGYNHLEQRQQQQQQYQQQQ